MVKRRAPFEAEQDDKALLWPFTVGYMHWQQIATKRTAKHTRGACAPLVGSTIPRGAVGRQATDMMLSCVWNATPVQTHARLLRHFGGRRGAPGPERILEMANISAALCQRRGDKPRCTHLPTHTHRTLSSLHGQLLSPSTCPCLPLPCRTYLFALRITPSPLLLRITRSER